MLKEINNEFYVSKQNERKAVVLNMETSANTLPGHGPQMSLLCDK